MANNLNYNVNFSVGGDNKVIAAVNSVSAKLLNDVTKDFDNFKFA